MKLLKSILILFVSLMSAIAYAGGNIAFVANIDGNWDLFTTDKTGQNTIRLTQTPFDEKAPSWSSDRKKIVYATSDGALNILTLSDKKSYKIDENRPNPGRMTPAFQPGNAQVVAFAQFIPGSRDQTNLMLYNAAVPSTKTIIDQDGIQLWPAWSPDGKKLIYASSHCTSGCGKIIQELWVTVPQGGWARQFLLTNAFCQQPAWSPNGKKIAYSSDQSGNFDIWIVSIETGNNLQMTSHESLDINPSWSPDAKEIAFVSLRTGIMEIWIKDVETDSMRKLAPFDSRKVECKDISW